MKQTGINYYLWAASAICAVVYFFIVYRFSINIPMDDDFPSLQNFLVQFIQAESIGAKISLLWEAGNMHRLLWMRFIVLFVYVLSGELNYSVYIFITSLFLSGIGVLFYWVVRKSKRKEILVLVMVLLLFNGQNLGNSIWAMSGLANIGSIFITVLSIYLLLLKKKWAFACGILLSIITIYSNGNGMLVIPPVIACFWIQKRIKELFAFGILSVAAAMFYFYGLDSSRIEGSLWSNIHVVVMNIFVFAGCNLWIPSAKYISLLAGLGCAAVYLWGIINKVYKENLFLYACLTFLFLTAIAVAAGNSPVLGGESTTPWRYRIYGSLFLILTSFLVINNAKLFHARKFIYLFPIMALLFSVFSTIYCYRKGERRYEQKMVSAYRWHKDGKGLGLRYPQVEDELISGLKEAKRLGLYTMPQYPISNYKNTLHPAKEENRQSLPEGIKYNIEAREEGGFLLVDGWAYLTAASALMEQEDIYIYLVHDGKRWSCRPNFERRFDIIDDTAKADCGFLTVIDKKEVPPGTYRIEIGIRSRFKMARPVYFVLTGQTVEI